MSLVSFIGPRPNLLGIDDDEPADAPRGRSQPVLDLRGHGEDPPHRPLHRRQVQSPTSSTSATRSPWGARRHGGARSRRCAPQAEDAVRAGLQHPHPLRPRASTASASPIPALLATAAVHQHLVAQGPAHQRRPGGRDRLGARGAPLRAARRLRRRGDPPVPRARDARRRCTPALPDGVGRQGRSSTTSRRSARACYKVMSKMGISTYMSYCGAQIFEAVGPAARLRRQVLHRHRVATSRASACSRSPRRRCACTARRSATIRCSRDALDAGGEYAYRDPRRGAHVDAGRDRQAAARHARRTATRPTRNTRSSSTTRRGGT